jgi:adenine-specific DNA-methyltransferase
MAKKQTTKQIEQYEHSDKERANNPHVGLVTPASDPDTGEKKTYQYDPHLDPQLQWAGKAEHTSFEVPTVSLHVHERIDPNSIIETVKKEHEGPKQMSLFETNEKPLREAIDFYKHKENWSNRLIAGDSLLVMNSLLEKEGMAGKVQMVYFDPPYGIKYGSNFQPFVNKRDVKDGKDEDLSAEPEMIKAFRDTWELGVHSYLTYLRDRLLVTRELLSDSGSVFVQISDENLHHVREIMDEVFNSENFIGIIAFKTATNQNANRIQKLYDYLVWYGKSKDVKFNRLFRDRTEEETSRTFNLIDDDGSRYKAAQIDDFKDNEINILKKEGRLTTDGKYGKRKPEDFAKTEIDNVWYGTIISTFSKEKKYVVQTSTETVKRALIMTTDPGDLVLDITCGSGVTAFVCEEFGRRWITCDTSRVSITLAKQRLMTALFPFYELAYQSEGISSGFKYKTVPHISLKMIARQENAINEYLFDDPLIVKNKQRITGPFTVEAVPAPYAKSFDELDNDNIGSDTSIARTGETLRQSEWRDELLKSGVRAKGGNIIQFTRVEPLAGTRFIQAEAETKEDSPKKVLVVFGPEHAPLEQRMVENAWQEARTLKPDMLLFCAFQFDEEAAKDIDELTPAIAGMQLLKAQMNADMLTDDLRKNRSSNESFWLVGQPDVKVHKLDKGKVQVEVMGFDYYNPKTGNVESGGKKNIAMWMLDTDYDNRSLFPSQVFFPMAGTGDGWDKLAKNLKAEIDEEKIESFKGTLSLEFEPGNCIAVKIIDDRGIESLRVINM